MREREVHIVPDDGVGDEMLKMYLEFWDVSPPSPPIHILYDAGTPQATLLWHELNREEFHDSAYDYGYGGEVYNYATTDYDRLFNWIIERERRLLGGMTLEEFVESKKE